MKKSAVFTLGLGRVLQIAIVFLTYRAVTTVLPQDELGFFFLLQALAGFFGLIVVNPVGTFLNREIHGWETSGHLRPGLRSFLGFSWIAAIFASLIIAGLCLFGVGSLGSHEPWLKTAFTTLVMVAGATIANTFIPLLNILERRLSFVLMTVLSQAIALGFSFVVILRGGANASSWMLATGAVQIAFGLFAFGLLIRTSLAKHLKHDATGTVRTTSLTSETGFRSLWSFAAPIAIANFAVWGLMQGYRPLVENFAGLGALSIIGLGLGLASSIASSFEALVQQVFLPAFYRRSHSGDPSERERNWNTLWQVSVPSYLGLVIVMAGLAPHFVDVLSYGSYQQAALYLAIGVGAEFLRMLGNLVVLYAQSERNTKPTRLPYFLGAFAALLGSLYAVHISELQYVAYALVLGQGVATVALVNAVLFKSGTGSVTPASRAARFSILKLRPQSLIRFSVLPVILVYLTYELSSPVALASVALGMGILTIHYWWEVREK